jgi:DNA-binding CsgD family transcriptional regulator
MGRCNQDIPLFRPPGLRAEWVEINGERLLMLSHPLESREPAPLPGLTAAERAIVEQVVAGRSNTEIAAERGTSPRTVAKQLERIYARVGVSSRAELCVRALNAGSLGAQ